MTVTTADLLSSQAGSDLTFDLHVTLVRYVHAADEGIAIGIGAAGLELTQGSVPATAAAVEAIVARQPTASPYRHTGEDGLWRVSIDIDASVRAASEEDAAEASHQLVTISPSAASGDAFEFELEVWPPHRG